MATHPVLHREPVFQQALRANKHIVAQKQASGVLWSISHQNILTTHPSYLQT